MPAALALCTKPMLENPKLEPQSNITSGAEFLHESNHPHDCKTRFHPGGEPFKGMAAKATDLAMLFSAQQSSLAMSSETGNYHRAALQK
eukprot:1717178-Amphidinium_carterae.1